MKRITSLLTIVFIMAVNGLYLGAQLNFSGTLDSSVSMRAGSGDTPDFSCGIEEFANIRFQARLRDRGRFEGAVNLFAASGDYAAGPVRMGIAAGHENYVAGIELERLFFRLNFENTDFDGGLLRMPFGYGQVWGSTDFLNPKNPLKPDARLRAVLGAMLTWYPTDGLKLLGFGTAPRDPLTQDGSGGLAGILMERHWDKASLQALYSFETPKDSFENSIRQNSSKYGIHYAGLSLKADLLAGFVVDVLYAYNHEAAQGAAQKAAQKAAQETGIDGLSFSAGFDYSFFEGNLIILAEYLYNGASSSTALGYGGGFSNEHYLYTGFTWRFNDFTNASIALVCGLSDISFTPVVSVNHDLFQGAALTVTMQVPMDRDLLSGNGKRGELGPLPPDHLQPFLKPELGGLRMGRYFDLTARLRLRF